MDFEKKTVAHSLVFTMYSASKYQNRIIQIHRNYGAALYFFK